MRIIECNQGGEEWLKIRLGVPTASNFDKIICSNGKGSKQAEKYAYQLAGEIVSGKIQESVKTQAMQTGIERESEASELYELMTGYKVRKVGFCITDNLTFGCSPDGLIDEDGGLEIKCPSISTHVQYMVEGVCPQEYIHQVQGNLFVTNRLWWDFFSYFPGLKPFLVRVYPDEKYHQVLKIALDEFNEFIREIKNKIK